MSQTSCCGILTYSCHIYCAVSQCASVLRRNCLHWLQVNTAAFNVIVVFVTSCLFCSAADVFVMWDVSESDCHWCCYRNVFFLILFLLKPWRNFQFVFLWWMTDIMKSNSLFVLKYCDSDYYEFQSSVFWCWWQFVVWVFMSSFLLSSSVK